MKLSQIAMEVYTSMFVWGWRVYTFMVCIVVTIVYVCVCLCTMYIHKITLHSVQCMRVTVRSRSSQPNNKFVLFVS